LSAGNPRPLIHVVAAAVIDPAARVLIAQRPKGTHLAGGWEFPGGKLEQGEERAAGLARELHEELGITIATPRPLMRVRHAYPSRDVLLDMWIVKRYRGEPKGLDGQALRWCTREELATVELLPADGPIVRALWLPERLTEALSPDYCIRDFGSMRRSTGDAEASPDSRLQGVLCQNTEDGISAAAAGADFLVMRSDLPNGELAALCASVPVPIYTRGMSLKEAWEIGASGLNDINE
jgi:mutator protein MutT